MPCNLCGDPLEHPEQGDVWKDMEVALVHLRDQHKIEFGDGPKRWPDGGIVLEWPDPQPEDVQKWTSFEES